MAITRPEPHGMSIHALIPTIRLRHPQIYATLSKSEKQMLVAIVSECDEPNNKVIDRAYRQLKAKRQLELDEFFIQYQSPEADGYELQKRAEELKPSDAEWANYHSRRIAAGRQF